MTVAHFLALAGDPAAIRMHLSKLVPASGSVLRLDRRFDAPGLVLFATPETPVIMLEARSGIVIGQLFGRGECSGPAPSLLRWPTHQPGRGSATSLLADHWGSYAAFLLDGERITVLRDPSARVPVYHTGLDGLDLYFSGEPLGRAGGLTSRGVDEGFLRQWLTYPHLRGARTGIEAVHELLPGNIRHGYGPSARIETGWNPWHYVMSDRLTDFSEAAMLLRNTVIDTVAAQLAGSGEFALQLSGGLDSSIVAAALAECGIGFHAVNFVTRSPDGDERIYAQAMAAAASAELTEIREDELGMELVPPPARLRPALSSLLQPLDRALARYAAGHGVRTFATGAGGDNLFCYLSTTAPVLDAMREAGPRQALATLADVAELGECTLWTAAAYSLRKRARLKRRPRWKSDLRFIAAGAVAAQPDPHPWLDAPAGVPPGKLEHVDSLVRAHHFMEPDLPSGEEILHPLINQPLIELCLSIPTWLWVRGGRNRAVAREAFADMLPASVLQRRTKGRLESMCARAFAAARPALAELLLDGLLRRRQLIDARGVEHYLSATGAPAGDDYYRLLDLASLELWLRSRRG